MSTRANSLRNLVLDGLYFAAIMSAFGVLTTTFAAGAEPSSTPLADVATDRRLTDDHIDSQLNTDDNMPSGDPTESAAAARETNILGMKLFEVRPGAVRVDDVTAASPAWDAGIRPGDQLLSIEGVKIRKLAPWVEDIAKLLDDQKDGHAVAAQIVRKEEQLDLRIKLPISRAAEARDARKADLAVAEQARKQAQGAGQPQQPGSTIVNTGEGERDYYGPGYVGGGGLVGGGYADGGVPSENADDRNPDRAIAQLAAVNTFGGGASGQIGLATFQTSGSSVAANVIVRGLPQGSYVVGIDDGGGMVGAGGVGPYGAGYDGVGYDGIGIGDPNDPSFTGENGAGMNGRSNRNANSRRDRLNDRRNNDPRMQNQQNGQQPMPGQQVPGQGNPNQPLPNQQMPQQPMPMPQQPIGPAGPAAGGAAPAGGASGGAPAGGDGASLANPNGPVYLGQQLDPAMSPASGPQRQQPAVPGAAGNQVRGKNQLNRNADPRVNSPNNVPGNTNPGVGGLGQPGGPQFLRELGVLNVGPDGSGQVQTRLDGIQVRSLIGLSVTVASTASAGGNAVGPNGNAIDPRVNSNPATSGVPRNAVDRAAASNAALRAGQNQAGPGVVATGVIQLAQGNAGFGIGGGNEEPNYNESLDPATERLRDRNFDASDPRQDFDPSNPRQTFDPSQSPTNPEQQNFDPVNQPGVSTDQDFDPAQ
jgi:membrane-associated protease RseP (regulator of RpoE activity)